MHECTNVCMVCDTVDINQCMPVCLTSIYHASSPCHAPFFFHVCLQCAPFSRESCPTSVGWRLHGVFSRERCSTRVGCRLHEMWRFLLARLHKWVYVDALRIDFVCWKMEIWRENLARCEGGNFPSERMRLSLYVYVCMYVCTYMYACIRKCLRLRVYVYVYVHVYIYIYIYGFMCMCTWI